MALWIEISDGNVRSVWVCPECKARQFIPPDFYQESGTPVCEECEEDMRYVCTQLNTSNNSGGGS